MFAELRRDQGLDAGADRPTNLEPTGRRDAQRRSEAKHPALALLRPRSKNLDLTTPGTDPFDAGLLSRPATAPVGRLKIEKVRDDLTYADTPVASGRLGATWS